ncbi:sugar efflux transporter [Hamadaea tsunoensis]|uniref:sugar efflux transporter n=1 Tax=Hamadaea tsunoensis TaxID=53368 RepID=UPI0003FD8A30|nr:sugar efflux transporter [Hamadaea tsunoensis]
MLRSQLRQWYPLGLVFLATGLSVSLAYPFVTLFLNDAVHADPVHVTLYLVTGPLAGVVFAQLIGRLSDRRPVRRALLLTAAGAGTIAMLVNAFVRDYWILLGVVATLSAISFSLMSQGFAYARAILAGSDKAAMTASALRMLFSLAWVGGPPIAAWIQSTGGFSALYATAAGMYAVAAIVTFAMLPEPAPLEKRAAAEDTPSYLGQDAPWRTVAGTLVAFTLLQGAGSVGVQMLALFLATDLHSGVREAGLILGLCAGLEIPLMLAFGALSTRFPVRRLILVGPSFSVAYLVLASVATHSWMLFAGQLLNATSIAAIQGLGVTYVQDMMPRQPGKASALYGNSFAAGTILTGPLIAIAPSLGFRNAYLVAAGLCLLGFGLIAVCRPPQRAAAVPGPAVETVAA